MLPIVDKKYRLLLLPPALMATGMILGRLIGYFVGPAIASGLARNPKTLDDTAAFAANFFAPLLSSGDNMALLLGGLGLVLSMPVAARALRRSTGA